jgi:ABC-type transporter MlaC component
MKNYDGNWRVYDVAVEGVRLVHNYRTQFSGMLDRMSYHEFVDKLRQKAAGEDDS